MEYDNTKYVVPGVPRVTRESVEETIETKITSRKPDYLEYVGNGRLLMIPAGIAKVKPKLFRGDSRERYMVSKQITFASLIRAGLRPNREFDLRGLPVASRKDVETYGIPELGLKEIDENKWLKKFLIKTSENSADGEDLVVKVIGKLGVYSTLVLDQIRLYELLAIQRAKLRLM